MNKNLTAQTVYRTAYLTVALAAFFSSIGFWSIGTGKVNQNVNPYFFLDYFNWALVMSIVVTAVSLTENIISLNKGEREGCAKKLPVMRFATMSTMIFCFILGAFFINRVGYVRLTDSVKYGDIYPAIITAGYWTDLSVLLARFVCPVSYIVMSVLFDECGKTRKLYSELGIIPPTVFYLFDKFFGMIFISAHGGVENVISSGLYEIACPFFFYDEHFTYSGWWWIILWPSIFGVALVTINKITFILSRLKKTEEGKWTVDTKSKPEEEELNDFIHKIKVKIAAKKAAANEGGD